jgi:hypothetical protein
MLSLGMCLVFCGNRDYPLCRRRFERNPNGASDYPSQAGKKFPADLNCENGDTAIGLRRVMRGGHYIAQEKIT